MTALSLTTDHPTASGLEALREAMPAYARDIKLNLGIVLSEDGAPELTLAQRYGVALASAYATRNADVIAAIEAESAQALSDPEKNAARAAATIMAMNNVYYRFIHLAHDEDIKALPPKLRMNVIGSPGIAKVDFELYCLAVSAINGCGMCMEAHLHEVARGGVSKLGIQSAVRIAAVINAAAQGLAHG